MTKARITTVCLFCACLHTSFLFASESERVKEVLNEYENYLEKLNFISFNDSTELQSVDKKIEDKTEDNSLKHEWAIDFLKKKAWKKTILNESIQRLTVFPTYYSEISLTSDATVSLSHGKFEDDNEWLIQRYIFSPDKFWKELSLGIKSYPFGLVNDEQSEDSNRLVSIMQSGRLELETLEGNGDELVRLTSTSTRFIISLHLNITKGFVPTKIEITQKHIPKDTPNRLEFAEYAVTEFQDIDGIWLPKTYAVCEIRSEGEYSLKESLKGFSVVLPQGDVIRVPKKEILTTVTLSNVVIKEHLDHDFFIRSKIPNGTPVIDRDAPQIQYIWYDGKIVPKTNEVMLAIARGGHKFMPGPESPRFWLMGISILLILIGGGMWVYKNFIRKNEGI